MTDWHQLTLTSTGPIDRVHLRLERSMHGWALHLLHAHEYGPMGECGPDVYEGLSLGEALDVIDATVSLYGHATSTVHGLAGHPEHF